MRQSDGRCPPAEGADSFAVSTLFPYLPAAPGCTEEFDEGAVTPVLVLPKFPTALFRAGDEPSVFADEPMVLPVVPWLFALLALAPGAPPVPFMVAPLLRVVPAPEDAPPVDALGEPPAELPAAPAGPPEPADPPPLPPPPPPLLCPKADIGMIRAAIRRTLHEDEDMDRTPFSRQRRLKPGVPDLESS
jgi:hypothetical protein